MKDFIAYCGIDCETCEARLATVNNDEAQRQKIAKQWSEMYQADITPEMINCTGCRIGGVKTPYCESMCPIRPCAMGKKYQTCGSCAELETCEKMAPIIKFNPDVLRNLKP